MKLLYSFFLFLFSLPFAQADTGDSLHILIATDTVIMTIDDGQQKLLEHTIENQQTLYRISRFYGVTVPMIMAFNPNKDQKNLSPGDRLQIPIPNRAIRRFRKKNFDPKKYIKIYYKVKKGDTLYGIAKRAFRMPIDTIKKRNNLKSGISPGQLLHVGWINLTGVSKAKGGAFKHPLSGKVFRLKQAFLVETKGKKIRKHRGAAFWKKTKAKGTKLHALHNYAKIGSIIEVFNPMSKRTLYVKVIGRINPRVTPSNAKVVLSPAAADYLGAINHKFYTEIRY